MSQPTDWPHPGYAPQYAPQPGYQYAPQPPAGPVWSDAPPVPPELAPQPRVKGFTAPALGAMIFATLLLLRVAYALHVSAVADQFVAGAGAGASGGAAAAAGSTAPQSAAAVASQRNELFGITATRRATAEMKARAGTDRPLRWLRVRHDGTQAVMATEDDQGDIVYSDRPDDGVYGPVAPNVLQNKPVTFDELNPAAPGRILRGAAALGYQWQSADLLQMMLEERPAHDGKLWWRMSVTTQGGTATYYADADGRHLTTNRADALGRAA